MCDIFLSSVPLSRLNSTKSQQKKACMISSFYGICVHVNTQIKQPNWQIDKTTLLFFAFCYNPPHHFSTEVIKHAH